MYSSPGNLPGDNMHPPVHETSDVKTSIPAGRYFVDWFLEWFIPSINLIVLCFDEVYWG